MRLEWFNVCAAAKSYGIEIITARSLRQRGRDSGVDSEVQETGQPQSNDRFEVSQSPTYRRVVCGIGAQVAMRVERYSA